MLGLKENRSLSKLRSGLIILASLLCAGVSATFAAQVPKPTPPPPKAESIDPLGRDTPRNSLEGMLRCVARGGLATAARSTPGVNLIQVIRQAQALRSHFDGTSC